MPALGVTKPHVRIATDACGQTLTAVSSQCCRLISPFLSIHRSGARHEDVRIPVSGRRETSGVNAVGLLQGNDDDASAKATQGASERSEEEHCEVSR